MFLFQHPHLSMFSLCRRSACNLAVHLIDGGRPAADSHHWPLISRRHARMHRLRARLAGLIGSRYHMIRSIVRRALGSEKNFASRRLRLMHLRVRALNFLSPCLTSHFLFLDRVVFTAVFGRTVYLLPTRTFLNSVTSAWCALRRVLTQITFCQGQDGECGPLSAVSSFPHALTSFLRALPFPLIFKSRAPFFSLSPLFISHLLILISSPSLFLSVCLSVSLSLSFSSLFSPPLFLSVHLSPSLSLPFHRCLIRWLAPEILQRRPLTTQSDAWAFGMTMWEIFTLCSEVPFNGVADQAVSTRSLSGFEDTDKMCPKLSMVLARAKGVSSVDCYHRYYDLFA